MPSKNTTGYLLKLSVFKKQIVSVVFLCSVLFGVIAPISGGILQGDYGPKTAYAQEDDEGSSEKDPIEYIKGCGVFGESSSIMGCITRFFYIVPYSLSFWALTLSAKMLDATATLTLSSRTYSQASFIQTGWRLTRDIANIFFIIILLYIALSLILGLQIGGSSPKKIFPNLILMAILVNFSMFATQVVIDISNSLALVFYNQISIVQQDKEVKLKDLEADQDEIYGEKVRPVSLMLAEAFKPQTFASEDFYNCLTAAGGNETGSLSYVCGTGDTKSNGEPFVAFEIMIPLLIIMGTLFLIAAYSFFIVAIAFLGRLISLWIAIIFAPIAFATYVVPTLSKKKGLGWQDWSSKLIEVAFSAPIYFFFMLLISLLAGSGQFAATNEGVTAGGMLMISLVATVLLIFLLLQATKYAKKASGEIGQRFSGFAETAAKGIGVFAGGAALGLGGLALGSGAGLAARAGRNTIGKRAYKLSQSNKLKDFASGVDTKTKVLGRDVNLGRFGQWGAQQILSSADKGSRNSFDARKTKLGNLFTEKTGINMQSYGGLSTASTSGGWEGAIARSRKKDEKRMALFAGADPIAQDIKNYMSNVERKEKKLKDMGDLSKKRSEINQLEKDIADKRASAVLDANGNPTGQSKVDINKMESQKTKLQADVDIQEKLRDEVNELKNGSKNKIKVGDTITDASGQTRKAEKKDTLGNYSLDELEKLKNNAENNRIRSYLYNKGVDSGYLTEKKEDALGNIDSITVDTDKMGEINKWRVFTRMAASTAIGGGIGTASAAAFGTALATGLMEGGMAGFLVNGVREAVNHGKGGGIGSRLSSAQAVQETLADKKIKEYNDSYKSKRSEYDGTKVLNGLRKDLKKSFGELHKGINKLAS